MIFDIIHALGVYLVTLSLSVVVLTLLERLVEGEVRKDARHYIEVICMVFAIGVGLLSL